MVSFKFISKELFDLTWIDFYNTFLRENKQNLKIEVEFKEWSLKNITLDKNRKIKEGKKFLILKKEGPSLEIYFKTPPGKSLKGIIEYLLRKSFHYVYPNSILLHAAALNFEKRAYLFLGPSGAGKTTFVSHFPLRNIINDERILLQKRDKKFYAKGINFWGRFRTPQIGFIEVAAIFFVFHGKSNRIIKMKKNKALALLLANSVMPIFEEDMKVSLELIETILNLIPTYYLYFIPRPDVKDYFLKFVTNGKK